MISLYDLLDASSGQLFGKPVAQIFVDFCIDAEQAADNQIFVVLKTKQGDTHQYIQKAIDNGASGIMCERPPDVNTDGITVILVRDCINALLKWSHYILGKFGTKVIGVTGSAGKSMATRAIALVLQHKYPVHIDLRDHVGRVSLPLTLAKLNADHKFVILKFGVGQFGEMAALLDAVQPEVGVVMHIGDLQTSQFEVSTDIAQEISPLINYLSPGGLAVLNNDDDLIRTMVKETRAQVKTVSLSTFGADMMAYNILMGPDGTSFDLRYDNNRYVQQWVPLLGQFHLYSIAVALCVGFYYGISLDDGLKALREITPLPGRMNPLKGINKSVIIDDTYNVNPQSVLAALDWLETVKEHYKRVLFVFGSMQNLGKRTQHGHRLIGKRAAEVIDVFVSRGTHAALSARSAIDYGMDETHVHTTYAPQDTIALLKHQYKLQEGDLVFIAGGANSRMETITKALIQNEGDVENLVRKDQVEQINITSHSTHLSWVDIDIDALAGNVRELKSVVGENVELMAVVKSNAYGHGSVSIARTAMINGASYLGVSTLHEALELRDAGIIDPILVFNYVSPHTLEQAIRHDVSLTLYDLDVARTYDRIAREVGGRIKIHVKIDSGMGRLGSMPKKTMDLFRHLMTMEHLEIEGIFTHFSMADEDSDWTAQQLKSFKNVILPLQATTGFKFKYIHTANSAATLAHPDTHFNMVRCGLAMYGMHPSEHVRLSDVFKPVLTWKTIVVQVKTLPADHPVGYGNTYKTQKEEKIAIIPVGYADGFRRAPENWGEVLVHGQRAPILGRVSMEKCAIGVSHISEVAIGDEVVLLGRQKDEIITAEEIAKKLGTINYEVTCALLPRIPR